MFSIRIGIFSLVMFFSVTFAFSTPVTQRETIQQEFEVTGIKTVTVINENGDIDLRTGGDKIELTAIRRVTALTENAAYETLNRTAIYVSKTGTSLQFNSPVPSGIQAYRVDYVLYVPAGMKVDLKTVNGKVICKDRNSPFKVESGVSVKVTLGNKEVDASVSDAQSDTTLGEQAKEATASNFAKVNGALNSLLHLLPTIEKAMHTSE